MEFCLRSIIGQASVGAVTMITWSIIGLSFMDFHFKIVKISFNGIRTIRSPMNKLRPSSKDKMWQSIHGIGVRFKIPGFSNNRMTTQILKPVIIKLKDFIFEKTMRKSRKMKRSMCGMWLIDYSRLWNHKTYKLCKSNKNQELPYTHSWKPHD